MEQNFFDPKDTTYDTVALPVDATPPSTPPVATSPPTPPVAPPAPEPSGQPAKAQGEKSKPKPKPRSRFDGEQEVEESRPAQRSQDDRIPLVRRADNGRTKAEITLSVASGFMALVVAIILVKVGEPGGGQVYQSGFVLIGAGFALLEGLSQVFSETFRGWNDPCMEVLVGAVIGWTIPSFFLYAL